MEQFIHRLYGTIVIVTDKKEIKKYQEDKNYYQYYLLQK